MTKPFIQKLDIMEAGNFIDELLTIAYNIEESLLHSGAEPGKDYTRLDLFKMAEPYMLFMLNDGKKMEYAYPSKKVYD